MWEKIYRTYRCEGLSGLKKKMISKFHTRYHMNIAELNPELINQLIKYPQFDFIALDSELLQRMYAEFEDEIPRKKYNALIDRINDDSSDKCYVVLDKEQKLYGFYCLSLGDNFDEELNYTVPADKETMYVFDDYTFESRRGNKAQQFAILSKFRIAYEMGYKYVSGIAMDGNSATEKASANIGFKEIDVTIDYYHLFGFKKNIVKEGQK